MSGMQSIVEQYNLKAHAEKDHGPFMWQRRMGVHIAFHRNPLNIFIHALFSIINAWAILLIMYPFKLFGLTAFGTPIDFAMVTLVVVFFVYARMDIGGAIVSTILFAATYPLCSPTYQFLNESIWLMLFLGAFLTLVALAIQVYIGHGIAEEGIDDAMENFAEAFETKNPTYIALLPFYTYLDLMFMAGYRPTKAQPISDITEELRPKLVASNRSNNSNNNSNNKK